MKLQLLKKKPVKCKLWRPVKKGEDCCCGCQGKCIANVIPNPTILECNVHCIANTSKENHAFARGFDYSTIRPSLLERMFMYIKAESSLLFEGEVSKRIFKQRMDVCRTCEHLVKSDDEVGHCGVCGCGMNSRASLTVKGRMPRAICVKGKWKK